MLNRKLLFILFASLVFLAACSHHAKSARCGDGVCDPYIGETRDSCPQDCAHGEAAVCGNGKCEPGENKDNCPADCSVVQGVCGNGVCDPGEQTTCPSDCSMDTPKCGDGICEPGENVINCPYDCKH